MTVKMRQILYKHNRNSGGQSDQELYIINMQEIISQIQLKKRMRGRKNNAQTL